MKVKEKLRPPTKRALRDASKLARRRHPAGGRVLAEASVARREGVRKRTAKRGTAKRSTKRS